MRCCYCEWPISIGQECYDIQNNAYAHEYCLQAEMVKRRESMREGTYDMNYVVGFAFNEDKSLVLLIQKKRPEWQAGRLNGVGGKCEEGERRPRDTMAREFLEETGIKTEPETWTQFAELLCPMDRTRVVFFLTVLADTVFDSASQTTDEMIVRASASVLHDEVLPNLRWLVPLARGWEDQNVKGSNHILDNIVLMERTCPAGTT